LTPFTAIQFDLVAAPNANMTFVLTQKAPNCTEFPRTAPRLIDSVYHPLAKYITPNGQKQRVTLPLSDFRTNVLGREFDLKHLKDFTIIDITPSDYTFQFSNFYLIGNCTNAPTTGSSNTPTGSKPPASTNSAASIFTLPWMIFFSLAILI
jgi:hypothetical protein